MLKSFVKTIIKTILKRLPVWMLLFLVRIFPRLAGSVPEKRKINFSRYLGNLSLVIDTSYPIDRGLLSGRYDPETLSVINTLVKPGDWCFDIGANVGAITLALAKGTGSTGKVFAFEPGLPTFGRLSANMKANPQFKSTVSLMNAGMGETESTLYWQEHTGLPGNGSLLSAPQSNTTPINVTTVDQFVARNHIDRLDFVKIDVEGMEYEVIKGGCNTWQQLKPVIYYETLAMFEEQKKEPIFSLIRTFLAQFDYQFFKIVNGNFKEITDGDQTPNTLAIPKERQLF